MNIVQEPHSRIDFWMKVEMAIVDGKNREETK